MTKTTKEMLREVLGVSKEAQEQNYLFAKGALNSYDRKSYYSDLFNKDCVAAMRIFCFIYERRKTDDLDISTSPTRNASTTKQKSSKSATNNRRKSGSKVAKDKN